MARLKYNIIANFAGKGWNSVIAIIFIPLYIRFMGIESYGVIGLYGILSTVLLVMNLGISATLSRRIAILSGQKDSAQKQGDLLKTLETVYAVILVVLSFFVIILAPVIARSWVRSQQLPVETIKTTVQIIAIVISLNFLSSFYQGGLRGLQRQILLNSILVASNTFRSVGVILVLWLISPTIQAFFLWQLIIGMAETLILRIVLHFSLPKSYMPARFQKKIIQDEWRFGIGMTGNALTSIVLTQIDKIVLSKILPLDLFGYYVLACNVANFLLQANYSVTQAVRPRLAQLIGADNHSSCGELYHYACQIVSVITVPVAVIIALFSHELMLLWTRDSVQSLNTFKLVSILICGSVCSAFTLMPYALQVSYGWVKLNLYLNVLMGLCIVPATIFGSHLYGALGVAGVRVLASFSFLLCDVVIMHQRLLCGQLHRWFINDIGFPTLAAVSVVGLCRMVFPRTMTRPAQIAVFIGIGICALTASAMAAPSVRGYLFKTFNAMTERFNPLCFLRKVDDE